MEKKVQAQKDQITNLINLKQSNGDLVRQINDLQAQLVQEKSVNQNKNEHILQRLNEQIRELTDENNKLLTKINEQQKKLKTTVIDEEYIKQQAIQSYLEKQPDNRDWDTLFKQNEDLKKSIMQLK